MRATRSRASYEHIRCLDGTTDLRAQLGDAAAAGVAVVFNMYPLSTNSLIGYGSAGRQFFKVAPRLASELEGPVGPRDLKETPEAADDVEVDVVIVVIDED